jgi:hypothetical protein
LVVAHRSVFVALYTYGMPPRRAAVVCGCSAR